jgi:hypothetical protein
MLDAPQVALADPCPIAGKCSCSGMHAVWSSSSGSKSTAASSPASLRQISRVSSIGRPCVFVQTSHASSENGERATGKIQ